jgi:hypothetical protein
MSLGGDRSGIVEPPLHTRHPKHRGLIVDYEIRRRMSDEIPEAGEYGTDCK